MYTADYTVRVSIVLLTTQASGSQDSGLNRTINSYNRPSNYGAKVRSTATASHGQEDDKVEMFCIFHLQTLSPLQAQLLVFEYKPREQRCYMQFCRYPGRVLLCCKKRGLNKLVSD